MLNVEKRPLLYPIRKEGFGISYPARLMFYVILVPLFVNFIVLYWAGHALLAAVIAGTLIEVLVMVTAVALWAYWHKLRLLKR